MADAVYKVIELVGTSETSWARNYFFSNGDIGGLINVAGAGILDSAENVTDARRLIEYLLSPDAQRYFADETFEYPLVEGVPIAAELPPLATLRPPSLDLNQLSDLEGTLELLLDTEPPHLFRVRGNAAARIVEGFDSLE